MNVKIFQLKENREKFLFTPWKYVIDCFDFKNYKEVWDCDFEKDITPVPSTNNIWNLDKIYGVFNYNHPLGYHGHSLSVSDIVKLDNEYFFCDSLGWENITDKIN